MKISSEILNTITKPALKIFPQVNSKQLSKNPSGSEELPIGLNYLGIQPEEIPRVDGLMLCKLQIPSEYLFGSTHPEKAKSGQGKRKDTDQPTLWCLYFV